MAIEIPVKFIYSSEDQRIYYVDFDTHRILENAEQLRNMFKLYPCNSFSLFNFSYEIREDDYPLIPSYNKDILNNIDEDDFLELSELASEDIKQTIYKIKDNLFKNKFDKCKLTIEVRDNSTIIRSDIDFGLEEEYIVKGLLNTLWNILFKNALQKPYPLLSINVEKNNCSVIFYGGLYALYNRIVYECYNGIATDEFIDNFIADAQKSVSNFFSHELYIFAKWYKGDELLYITARRDKKKQLLN